MNFGNQRGEGRIGFLISAAVLGAAIFVGARVIPVRVDAYNFRDTLREECRMGAVRDSDEVIVKRIMNEARDLGIPLERKNLIVRRTDRRLHISASYDQEVDLKVTKYVYRFRADEEAPLF